MPNQCLRWRACIVREAGGDRSKWPGNWHIAIAGYGDGCEDITSVPSFPNDWTKSGIVGDDHLPSMHNNTSGAI